jgi:hypothetical protein
LRRPPKRFRSTSSTCPSTVASTASTPARQNSLEDRDTLVCKDIATIGTRFTQRICKSKAQIAEEREAGKAWTDTRGRSASQDRRRSPRQSGRRTLIDRQTPRLIGSPDRAVGGRASCVEIDRDSAARAWSPGALVPLAGLLRAHCPPTRSHPDSTAIHRTKIHGYSNTSRVPAI